MTYFSDTIGNSSIYILMIFNILYFSTLFGIIYLKSSYIEIFNIIVHSLLCLFLIYRFNPMRKNIVVKKYDQILVFSTSIFLLLNLGIIEYVKKFVGIK